MKCLQPATSIAKIDDGSGSVSAGGARLPKAGVALVERAAEIGLAGNVAALYRDDPLQAEAAFRDMVFGLARSVLTDAFEALDGHGPSLEADGRTHRRAEVTPGRAMTMFGPVDFFRSRYRPSGTGTSLVPAEAVLGLTACGLTPAAGLLMYLMSGLTARESEGAWRVLVTSRMKRSGQSWGRDGGQGVLSVRSLLKSGRFDRAWAALVPSLSRSDGWKPPQCANENRPVAQVALAA